MTALSDRIATLEREVRERQELLTAYRRVRDDLGVLTPEGDSDKQNNEEPKFSWRSDNPSAAVRNAVRHMHSNFTLDHIAAWLRREQFTIERNTISFVLARFARTGEISVAKKGAGKRATIYKAISGGKTDEVKPTAQDERPGVT